MRFKKIEVWQIWIFGTAPINLLSAIYLWNTISPTVALGWLNASALAILAGITIKVGGN